MFILFPDFLVWQKDLEMEPYLIMFPQLHPRFIKKYHHDKAHFLPVFRWNAFKNNYFPGFGLLFKDFFHYRNSFRIFGMSSNKLYDRNLYAKNKSKNFLFGAETFS